MLLISHPPCPLPQEGGEVRAAALVKQGGLKSTTLSRCTTQRLSVVDDLYGGFAPPPRLVSTVCLTYKINYSIIRGKMQVKFSGENHGFLWQNVKFKRLIFEDKTIL